MPSDDRYGTLNSNGSQPTVTRTVTKSVVPVGSTDLVVDPDVIFAKKHEEWTTNKRIVNHKTKQVETRVQRQLVLEDGRVVADSGPQVTTKTKEDVRVEESENTEHKTTGDDPPGPGYIVVPGSAKVISEKTESNQTVTETREENRQMHDERIRDLSGEEIHQRTVISPDDPSLFGGDMLPGKLTHFSARSQKIVDKDEVREVSELKDGEVTTETTRTHHHEEAFDDEVPEEEAEEGMVPERSAETSRTIKYYEDPREFEEAEDRLREESRRSRLVNHPQNGGAVPAVAHRWLDDHFGGDTSVKTSSGGNRITIEMSGHRSSPSEYSTLNKHDMSRESTLRNNKGSYRVEYPSYNHHSTTRPSDVSSSSGSSRSKTPVKTFYLGQDNTWNHDYKKKSGHSFLADDFSSRTNSLGRSNLSGHYGERSDSFRRIPGSKIGDLRHETLANGTVYSKIGRVKTDKNVQVSMSDDDDDGSSTLRRIYGERSQTPRHMNGSRSTLTLPRTVKVTHESTRSPYSTNSLSHSRNYKSSDSLHSPGYSSYYSSNDYGSSNSFRNTSSPIYNNSSFHRDDHYRGKDGWGSSVLNNSSSGTRIHEVKISKKGSSPLTNGSKPSSNWYPSSSMKSRKFPTSPPESGYQSPFPPTPPSSPPPRVIKVRNSDHYGSYSSISPPDSPVHLSTASIRKKSAYPSGSASRSKSSSDLRTDPLFAPDAFSPLSSPLKLKTMGEKKADHRKYFRLKPGQDGQSVVVQVRDWNAR